ncbi:MAG: ComF family protein [Psychroserpens sp.]|uniref:ComF family protein n=1 Tax=Psychroserpens sp. TaxID=2020870 RepID=UPI001B230C43|nr:double zinc ribbon domain-containing protein [Psychroserpens sp.]MBO6605597.1 ComF family protein [Psychroserpens sp.]MBO6653594.1 ComF family protein [Psychroserpens sp.]MBO6681915.1 ComF family protein [Psychroserpens sp.]MBO6748971.1 ComF family protein [Psychroserpens sp.]MBO6915490.1 ComF family protein [Psychroserpens sp.]
MIKNLLNLFFPKVCLACNNHLSDNEYQICTNCRHELPLTNFHSDKSNAVHKTLYGRVKLENATALLHFSKKGRVQQLIHNLKYRGHEDVSDLLGAWLGAELKDIPEYQSIDVVVPVPLHKTRLRSRGFNQVDRFAKQIATAINADYDPSVLIKTANTKTQVFKNRLKRSTSQTKNFKVNDYQAIKNKHVLLVDDIITTGATVEDCATSLFEVEGLRLSLATMAITD